MALLLESGLTSGSVDCIIDSTSKATVGLSLENRKQYHIVTFHVLDANDLD